MTISAKKRQPVLQYGRACQACVLAKCKCVPREDQSGCERCSKYSKDCVPSDSPRRRAGERNASIARIAELEKRMHGFVETLSNNPSFPPEISELVPGEADPPTTMADATEATSSEDTLIDDEVSEFHYGIFFQRMTKYFPVVHIPTSPEALRRERPFLLLCIRVVTSPSIPTSLQLGRRIKQVIAQRIILDEATDFEDLDLLQGLLTYIAWSHDHLLRGGGGAPNVSRHTQLALALVYELGLNKNFTPVDSNALPVGDVPGKRVLLRRSWPHTMEEKRTLVGCFLLSSVVSVYFGQIDPLPLTEYMQSCITALSCSDDSPYDQTLAHMAQLQSLVNDVEALRRGSAPVAVYDKLFQHRIEELKRRQPISDESNGIILSCTLFAQLNAQTLALAGNGEVPATQSVAQRWACIETVKLALDNFFSVPVEDYDSLPFPYFAQLAGFLAVLMRLTTLTAAGWDMHMVRSAVDVLHVLDRIVENIGRAKLLLGSTGDGGFLARKGIIFASCKMACAAQIAEAQGSAAAPASQQPMDRSRGLLGSHSADAWVRDAFGYGVLGVTSIMM
ncbi:hypothetical protein PWT90_01636 [Aphanocladium album]|nr:hypothetical protein PWT90_01636 [Aphanocladium album]